MYMKKILASFFLLIFSSYFLHIGNIKARAGETEKQCETLLPIAVENLVHQVFGKDITHELKTYNDVLCEDPEDMANVVIVVSVHNREKQYGIFHLHYNHDGSISRIQSSFFDEQTWITFTQENEWHAQWCEIIRSVYPEERSRHNCFR